MELEWTPERIAAYERMASFEEAEDEDMNIDFTFKCPECGEEINLFHYQAEDAGITSEADFIQYLLDEGEIVHAKDGTLVCAGCRKRYGKTADGTPVYDHAESHPHRVDLAREALALVNMTREERKGGFCRRTVEMPRMIGYDHLVETKVDAEETNIYYFHRGNRQNKSRMVLNREAAPTNKVTVIMCRDTETGSPTENQWVLVTLFEGEAGRPETVVEFWKTHALVPTDEERVEINKEIGRS